MKPYDPSLYDLFPQALDTCNLGLNGLRCTYRRGHLRELHSWEDGK